MSRKKRVLVSPVVAYLTEEYHDWLDNMKALRFTRKEIVQYALELVMAMDRKELCSELMDARQNHALIRIAREKCERHC